MSALHPEGRSQAAPEKEGTFRPDIEGLRAVAILLVVAYHVKLPSLEGGFVGVDVFFVLSGYLITTLLLRELSATGSIAIGDFYARRARRLLPALLVTMLGTGLAASVLLAPMEQVELARTFAWTSGYASNVLFSRRAIRYLGGDAGADPLLHTWSLAVEEQFYLAWPLFVLAAVAGLWSWRRWRTSHLFISAAVLSFSLCLYLTHNRQPWAFFLSPPRAWEFAVGGLTALLKSTVPQVSVPWRNVLAWTGLGGIVATAILIDHSRSFPGFVALVPVMSTACVLGAGAYGETTASRFLALRPFQELGRLSYSWYLWHWPALVLAAATPLGATRSARMAVAFCSLLLAKASFHVIERPIRHHSYLLGRSWRYTLVLAVGLALAGVAAAVVWSGVARIAAEEPSQQAASVARSDLPAIYSMDGCDTFFSSADVKDCSVGPARAAETIVLLGDSHAGQWFPALADIAAKRNWRLVVLTKSACPVLDTPVFLEQLQREFTECREWLRSAVARIGELRPRFVIASSFTGYRDARSKEPLSPEQWRDGTSSIVGRLSRVAGSVVLLRDTPFPGFDVPVCVARRAWRPGPLKVWSCDFPPSNERASRIYEAQRDGIVPYSNVSTLDLSSAICPMTPCAVERSGTLVYRDTGHLTGRFVTTLAADLDGTIKGPEVSPGGASSPPGPPEGP